MGAVVFALAVLMWLWTAVSLNIVRALSARSEPALQSVWLALAIAAGAAALLAFAWLLLPASVLSQGWTREVLENTQAWSALLIVLAAVAGFLRGRQQLLPEPVPVAMKPAVASGDQPRGNKQKRRS